MYVQVTWKASSQDCPQNQLLNLSCKNLGWRISFLLKLVLKAPSQRQALFTKNFYKVDSSNEDFSSEISSSWSRDKSNMCWWRIKLSLSWAISLADCDCEMTSLLPARCSSQSFFSSFVNFFEVYLTPSLFLVFWRTWRKEWDRRSYFVSKLEEIRNGDSLCLVPSLRWFFELI